MLLSVDTVSIKNKVDYENFIVLSRFYLDYFLKYF